jgi:hypothetical protein
LPLVRGGSRVGNWSVGRRPWLDYNLAIRVSEKRDNSWRVSPKLAF